MSVRQKMLKQEQGLSNSSTYSPVSWVLHTEGRYIPGYLHVTPRYLENIELTAYISLLILSIFFNHFHIFPPFQVDGYDGEATADPEGISAGAAGPHCIPQQTVERAVSRQQRATGLIRWWWKKV